MPLVGRANAHPAPVAPPKLRSVWLVEIAAAPPPDAAIRSAGRALGAAERSDSPEGIALVDVDRGPSATSLGLVEVEAVATDHVGEQSSIPVNEVLAWVRDESYPPPFGKASHRC